MSTTASASRVGTRRTSTCGHGDATARRAKLFPKNAECGSLNRMPKCGTCAAEVAKFAKNKKCRACYNAYMAKYMLERYHQRRREAVAHFGGQCVRCGSTEQLEFDHVERALKRGEIAKLLSQGENRYLGELVKCQLLCKPCHIEKTRSEMTVGHGGGKTGISGCKCDPCRMKWNEYSREWKRKRREIP